MILRGKIPEIISHFDPKEKGKWVDTFGRRPDFPDSPRLAHCSYNQPRYYFGETVYARKLMWEDGYECWQERYKLFRPIKENSRYAPFNKEIVDRLGIDKMKRLNYVRQYLSFKPQEPDIVAWDTKTKKIEFYEVKLPHDKVWEGQIRGLALLQHICNANVAIVRLIPIGHTAQPASYSYCFELKDS